MPKGEGVREQARAWSSQWNSDGCLIGGQVFASKLAPGVPSGTPTGNLGG